MLSRKELILQVILPILALATGTAGFSSRRAADLYERVRTLWDYSYRRLRAKFLEALCHGLFHAGGGPHKKFVPMLGSNAACHNNNLALADGLETLLQLPLVDINGMLMNPFIKLGRSAEPRRHRSESFAP